MEDFNFLLDLKDQMGVEFSQDGIEKFIPNATKCMNWQDVKASHDTDKTNSILVITFEDIYGITILLALGLGGAITALVTECLISRFKKSTSTKKRTGSRATQNIKLAWKGD